MTNREIKIKETRDAWAECIRKKEETVHELWRLETKIKELGEKLCKYGEQDIPGMAETSANVD